MKRIEEFVAARDASWRQLEKLLAQVRRTNRSRLSGEEIIAFGALYRQITADLALAQRDYPHAEATRYLNALVGRAHAYVYRSEVLDLSRLVAFYKTEFPRAFREASRFVLAAFLISAVAAIGSFMATVIHPEAANILLDASERSIIPLVQQHRLWVDVPNGTNSAVASLIMTNNIEVAILAFAGGILFGLLTLYILLTNGIMLGTVAGLCQAYGLSMQLWTFILPHGVLELSVIFIAGGSGFMLGWSLLRPGLRRRTDALGVAARHAVRLIIGAAPLLIIAGSIEGFLSPSHAPALLKVAVGAGTGIVLYSYLLRAGRPRQTTRRGFALDEMQPRYEVEQITTSHSG